jgi:hypothetical protein
MDLQIACDTIEQKMNEIISIIKSTPSINKDEVLEMLKVKLQRCK